MGLPPLLASASRAENLSVFDPASPPAAQIAGLFWLVLAVCGVIFLVVEGVLVYSLFRFRDGPQTGTEPPQVYGSMPIEIAWTVAPALIVLLLTLTLVRTEYEVRVGPESQPTNAEKLFVTVVGHQWWWEYRYNRYKGETLGGTVVANELHVPVSEESVPRPVYLTLESADVCHSFWVPRLAGKTDLIPGRINETWFQTDKPGTYLGQCAEYCGTQHANMLLRVVVQNEPEFRAWIENERKPAREPETEQLRKGRAAFLNAACVSCHTVRGTTAVGKFGPDLTHVGSRETLAAGMVANSRDELRKWVDDPDTIKAGCLMPAMKLMPRDVDLIADYLWSLK